MMEVTTCTSKGRVRLFGEELRAKKNELAATMLKKLEKIKTESLGEIRSY